MLEKTFARQLFSLWKQILLLLLLTLIGGNFFIFLLVQHRYKKETKQQYSLCRKELHDVRQQLLHSPSISSIFEELHNARREHITRILQQSFENSSELVELFLLSHDGSVLWGRQATSPRETTALQAFSQLRGKDLGHREYLSFAAPKLFTVQLELQPGDKHRGFLRGTFLQPSSQEIYVSVTRFTLYSAVASAGALLLYGVVLVFTKFSRRFAAKQQQVEEYAYLLQQANESLRKTKKELYTSEKLASLGYLAAGIAHEIGNPLGAVLGYVELLQKGKLDPQNTADILERVEGDIGRIQRIIQELVNFSRPHAVRLQKLDVNALIRTSRMLHPSPETKQIHFQLKLTEFPLWAEVDECKLRNVFLNLIGNSIDAIEECGDITIRTFRKIRESGAMTGGSEVIAIQIEDTGSGIPEELVSKVFDPFFTTKEPGKGMGLGLSWCHRIIESFGGEMEIHSQVGHGTDVSIFLPPFRKRTGDADVQHSGHADAVTATC
ncbi:hypothetical protein CSB45_08465 [candidate division KSB3 bacterium]|uniref:histidine kinase n=1 Tax=candidate division KSB3 bacterium TaxID=2044937 RepID=A0A2G6E578_9BACT|nr:MAG: hypothetical protein CSB45_08465 [candidate division KSB3 bacterium]PIE29749.1 MAG: hypothetical protein CSA57_06750 [candidate division KSB3 bacterium]